MQPEAKNVLTTPTRQVYADPTLAAGQATDKIAAARVWLMKEKPFFGVLARAFQVEPSLKTPAFRLLADDRLLVNPLVVLELKFPSLCGRLAHLAMHAALGALPRRGPREPLRWNVAHDLAIEPLLRAASLPSGAKLPDSELPPGASAEEYYQLLAEGTRPDDLWCDVSDPPPPEGPDVIQGTFTRQDDGQGNDPGGGGSGGGEREGKGERPEQGGDQRPDEGDEGEEEREDGSDEPDEGPPLIEARSRELQWKMRLGAALEEELASGGKTFGEVPGWLDELVRATIEPPPDWSAALQRSVSMLTRTDRSFLRPSRRMSALAEADGSWPDVVAMPGRRVMPAGKLAVVIDTSASIEAPTLARFLGSISAIATSEGFDEVRLVQADAEVTKDETILAATLLFEEVGMIGRGGTDFGPALRKLALESRRMGERFTVVYLTDLDGRFPAAEETAPLEVLWVVPGKPARPPPFGKLVEMGWQR